MRKPPRPCDKCRCSGKNNNCGWTVCRPRGEPRCPTYYNGKYYWKFVKAHTNNWIEVE